MIEAGSFRDPAARVFYQDGRVLRGLRPEAADDDAAARTSGLMERLVGQSFFVDNWIVDDADVPAGVPTAAVVESARIPLITYPQEWSFAMLRDGGIAGRQFLQKPAIF